MAGVGPNHRSMFDDLEFSNKEIVPFWSIGDITNDKDVEKWMDNSIDGCQAYYRDYFQTQMDNLLLYKGIQWLSADRQANRVLDKQGVANLRNPRVVINHLADFTTQWVSRLTRYRPAVAIYPARSPQADADDAKIAKDVLDYIWYEQRVDEKLQEFARQMKIFGEAYMWILWDKQKGEISPEYLQAQQKGLKVPITGPDGEQIKNEQGEPMFMEKAPHIGDLDYVIDPPWHVFDQPCRNRANIDWSIRWYLEDVEYLKAKYPDKADKIKADSQVNSLYTGYRLDVSRLKNQIVVYEMYHRSHEFMEPGRFVKYVKGCVLENTENPYQHKKIPYIYLADIDVPDQIRGYSFFQQLFPMQHQVNACASLIYKSLVLFAHPKLVIQDGSCDMQQLLNESTVVSYSGGVPPTLLAQAGVSQELFKYQQYLEQTMEKISGIYTMSRGEAPSGVRAAKALRVLEEQEDKRSYLTAIKYNNVGLVENARMTISVAGTFYHDSDDRLANIVGRNNEYRIRQFKQANLTKAFHFRIENTTALSQSPAARIDDLTEMMQIRFDPSAPLTREQYFSMLNMTADEQFKDVTTRAVSCAQSENDDFLAGRPVADPTELEDLVIHWKIHAQAFQSREYKEMTDPAIKALMEEHFRITEYLMFEKGYGITDPMTGMPLKVGNPTFAQRLMIECPDFPLILQTPAPLALGPVTNTGLSGGPSPIASGVINPAPLDPGAAIDPGAPTAAPPMEQ